MESEPCPRLVKNVGHAGLFSASTHLADSFLSLDSHSESLLVSCDLGIQPITFV